MLTRKWFLTTVVCSGLLAVGISGGAQASLGLLQPDSDWAVSQLGASQAGGQPYCALARRFDDSLILTMARNAADEGSIAVDFQKPSLNNTQNYHVTLRPGFGQDRAFNIRPVSGKALVIRLGKDYAFYDALNRSGQLSIDISGETYAFNLTGLEEGYEKLSACLINLAEPAAGSSDAVTPMPAAVASPPASYTKVSEAGDRPTSAPLATPDPDVQALREENLRLRNALERERRIYEDRLMREGRGSSMAAEMSEKMRLLEMENGQLREQLAYQPAPEPLSCPEPDNSKETALQNELSAVLEENRSLKRAAETRQDSVAGLKAGMEAQLSSLRTENLTLKQDLAAQRAANAALETQLEEANAPRNAEAVVMDRLREQIALLEAENKALKDANAQASLAASSSQNAAAPVSLAQLRTLEEQLRFVQADRDKLLAKLESTALNKHGELLDISSDNWNLEQATRRFNEAEREIRRLGRQLEEARMQCAMEKKELEYMLFDPKIATEEQIAKLRDLENQVMQAQATLDAQKADYEVQISSLELEKVEAEQKLADMQMEMTRLEDAVPDPAQLASMEALENKIRELEERNAVLVNERENLTARIAMLEDNLGAIQASAGPASLPPPVSAEPVAVAFQDQAADGYGYGYDNESYLNQNFDDSTRQDAGRIPARLITASVLETVLGKAKINLQGDVKTEESDGDLVAYSWDTGVLFGSAEQQAMENAGQFDDLVRQYLDKTKNRCQGDFAAVPAFDQRSGTLRVASYEIACISGQQGASASLIFYSEGDLFTTIAHESGLDAMDAAMDARDRLTATLMQAGDASKSL